MKEINSSPRIIRLAETESTNNYMHGLLEKEALPEGVVIVADFQSHGKGQVGNSWESEAGKNLMFSVLLHPDFLPANQQFLISQISALAVQQMLETFAKPVFVKWPNDIYWNDKKICGMLIENDIAGTKLMNSIIGIGVNINQKKFYSNAPNPVSLTQITGNEYDLCEMLNIFLSCFFKLYNTLMQGANEVIRNLYFASLYRGKGYHLFNDANNEFEACIQNVEPSGHLTLALRNGEKKRYAFKEVSFVMKSLKSS